MKTNNLKKEKASYCSPLIERIILDNEISLSMVSTPPEGPGGSESFVPEYLNNDPFKTNVG